VARGRGDGALGRDDGRGKKRLRLGLVAVYGPGRGRFPVRLSYLAECRWLREYGLISNFADYQDLPLPVLEEARLLMEAQDGESERQAAKARATEAKAGRR
jgi:hypothetical protein